ncbi:helix-turn-helix domain-containing protein [Bifidobacterium pullorum subsp. gallinarum]
MPLVPSYKPLRKLLVERDMKVAELYKNGVISRSTASVLNMDRFVSLETLALICEYLNCRIEDVVEFVDDGAGTQS